MLLSLLILKPGIVTEISYLSCLHVYLQKTVLQVSMEFSYVFAHMEYHERSFP